MTDNIKRLFSSCFGLGWLPVAPGTWGSLPAVVIFVLACSLGASPLTISIIMAALVLIGSFVCVKLAPAAIVSTGKNDPGEVVADEFAGQAVAFSVIWFFVAETEAVSRVWAIAIAGFLLFRLFDILKPWPIQRIEKLPAGWGILCDDLLAGLYAALGLHICWLVYNSWVLQVI